MGYLTTHVLDTARGCPAACLRIRLARLAFDGTQTPLVDILTNDDGRADEPLLSGEDHRPGVYQLVFSAGAYHAALGLFDAREFLDEVVVQFTIDDAAAHYHVPLLLSPFGYSTYRGS